MTGRPDAELLEAVAAVLRENGEPYPVERAGLALEAAVRVLGKRLRAAAAEYDDDKPSSAFKAGLALGWFGAALAVESACGVAPGDEGKQGV